MHLHSLCVHCHFPICALSASCTLFHGKKKHAMIWIYLLRSFYYNFNKKMLTFDYGQIWNCALQSMLLTVHCITSLQKEHRLALVL